jgi:hypothetical protein
MKKFIFALVVIVLVLIVGILFYKSSKGKTSTDSPNDTTTTSSSESSALVSGDIIMKDAIATLYYGDGCPHCTNMEKWLQDNKYLPSGSAITQTTVDSWATNAKVKFNLKEVWKNSKNSSELSANATKLGIASSQVGVPFLYDSINNKSYVGETDIIAFFQSQK